MMKSSWDFARLLKTVSEVRQNQHINDNDRIAMLREMQSQLPPEKMSIQATNSRAIIERIIQETLNGYQTPKATAKKPKSSGKGQTSMESSEEQLLRNANVHTRGKSVKKRMVN